MKALFLFWIGLSMVCGFTLPPTKIRKPVLVDRQQLGSVLHGPHFQQLVSMISDCTSNPHWGYFDYGCYCGLGGSGTPVDSVDRCCQIHDACYTDVLTCQNYNAYLDGFEFTCDKTTKAIQCRDPIDSCERKTCECDRALAECFDQTVNDYNQKYFGYRGKECEQDVDT